MKSVPLAVTIALLLCAMRAQAAGVDNFVIACPATRLPSHADVVRVFDVHNLGKVFDLRQRVRAFALRECKHGADRIEIVAEPEHPSSGLRNLARR